MQQEHLWRISEFFEFDVYCRIKICNRKKQLRASGRLARKGRVTADRLPTLPESAVVKISLQRLMDAFDKLCLPKRAPHRRASAQPAQPARIKAEAATSGERLRRPVRPQDLVLSVLAQRWVAELPTRLRPRQLLLRYPRIANRLALCWCDAALSVMVLDSFLIDLREVRRAGFPRAVAAELCALQIAASRRLPVTKDPDLWGMSADAAQVAPMRDTSRRRSGRGNGRSDPGGMAAYPLVDAPQLG